MEGTRSGKQFLIATRRKRGRNNNNSNTINTKKNTRRNLRNVAARYQNVIPKRLPRLARMGTPTINPPVSIGKWNQLKDEIDSIPFYLILCHAALCPSYAKCQTPKKTQLKPGIPTYFIPKNTYLMSFTSGGESCMFGPHTMKKVYDMENEFRNFLLLDDPGNISRAKMVNSYPFLSEVKRAAPGSEYPNISCTFHEHNPRKNENGVFRVYNIHDILNSDVENAFNEFSIIKQNEPGPYLEDPSTWYLDDIIHETYTRTGDNRGIFLFAGCTGNFIAAEKRANLVTQNAKAIDTALSMIYEADAAYPSKVSAFDLAKITAINPSLIPHNIGSDEKIAKPDETFMASMSNATSTPISTLFPEVKKEDPAMFKGATNVLKA